MRISKLSWTNYKGLHDGEINADGRNVIIRGQNASGKSSIANILHFVLFGKSSGDIQPYQDGRLIINDNVTHAAQISFTDGTSIRREIFNGSTSLFINGKSIKATPFKAFVNQLTNQANSFAFNPFALFELKAPERRKFILELLGNHSFNDFLTDDESSLLGGSSPDYFIEATKRNIKVTKQAILTNQNRLAERELDLKDAPDDLDVAINAINSHINAAQCQLEKLSAPVAINPTATLANQANSLRSNISRLEFQLNHDQSHLDDLRLKRKNLLSDHSRVKNSKPSQCPTCGQPLPQEIFLAKRQERLLEIVADGQRNNERIRQLEKDIAIARQELDETKAQLATAEAEIEQANANSQIQADAETKRQQQLAQIKADLSDLNQAHAHLILLQDSKDRRDSLIDELKHLNKKLVNLEGKLTLAKDILQRLIVLFEQAINQHFAFVKFKLFDFAKTTGELKTACEPTLHDVPFAALSKGEKLKCALDIFCSLQKKYGVQFPLFIDDAESYTLNSFVDLPNQIWLFKVSDDDKLIIDVESEGASHGH